MDKNDKKSITYDYIIKCLLVGDSSVGKSCIFLRLTEGTFTENHISTVGVDFKNISLIHNGDNVGFQIWDTAGQERYLSITKNYFKHSKGIVLIYDVGNKRSFENINFWLKHVKDVSNFDEITVLLIGNKCDLQNDLREVTYEDGFNIAKEYNLLFEECSAKTGYNVKETFDKLSSSILNKRDNQKRASKELELKSFDLNDWNKSNSIKKYTCCSKSTNN